MNCLLFITTRCFESVACEFCMTIPSKNMIKSCLHHCPSIIWSHRLVKMYDHITGVTPMQFLSQNILDSWRCPLVEIADPMSTHCTQ